MSFIDSGVAASFSAEFESFFDYFARPIVVHKEPIQVINQVQQTNLYGYNSQSNDTNYTYIPVTGVFMARISYQKNQVEDLLADLRVNIPQGKTSIIVKEAAKDFISEGKTIKIEFDGKTYNSISTYAVRKYLNNTYYQYFLEETK